jgi:hypothetical protein
VADAARALVQLVAERLPQRFYRSEQPWRSYGPAMVARMADVVQSTLILMAADRVMDGGVMVRVLYEHVVKFCWIAIDPDRHLALWSEDALCWERKLHTDLASYEEGFLTDDELDASSHYKALKLVELAHEADQHWEGRIVGFVASGKGPQAKYTLRHLYNPVYRTLSEPVHARPEALRGNMELGRPRRVSLGQVEVADVFWWPLIVTLYAKALLVCAARFGWPDPERVRRINNGMYRYTARPPVRGSGSAAPETTARAGQIGWICTTGARGVSGT